MKRWVVVAFALILAGCSATTGSTVDGFVLGPLIVCGTGLDQTKGRFLGDCRADLARAALDSRDPAHAAMVSYTAYADGSPSNTADPHVIIYVFKLADGSTVATGAACPFEQSIPCYGVGSYPR